MLREGKLIYRNGSEFFNVQEKDVAPLNDGEWKNILLSCEGGKVSLYIDGKYVNQIDNRGSTLLDGHVLRIGQGPNIYRLGASDLPIPFRGEAFDGEIRKVRFFKQALSKSEVSELFNGNKTLPKSLVLDWKVDLSHKNENIIKGPIRIQSDLSKIRYANIWLQPLGKK